MEMYNINIESEVSHLFTILISFNSIYQISE